MKKLIIAVSLLTTTFVTNAQMGLDHVFTGLSGDEAKVVNLSISGKKLAVLSSSTSTLKFYNLDYSLWKTITIPTVAGYTFNYDWESSYSSVLYPSETLYNTDDLLEVGILYKGAGGSAKLLVVNESNVVVDSVLNLINTDDGLAFAIYNTATNTFKAIAQTTTGVAIYTLPGTIPCELCGGGLGIGKVNTNTGNLLDPVPNPSKSQVKLTFTLPEGANQGEIAIYNTNGQLLKTYKVDNTFGFITIDNSMLPAGMYYYNLTANGDITTTKKMLVIR